MLYCSFFECLAYSAAKCEKHNGCAGCQTFSSCESCGRQETLIDGIRIPCEHMRGHGASAPPAYHDAPKGEQRHA